MTTSAKDYRSSLKPVWCSGCGDYGVLKGLTQALSDLNVPPEKLALVSGIGCSSRLPGYTNSYGFNSVHGRALPIAAGIKAVRPDLTTVVVGGDGDGFSIGVGHIPHAARRNLDVMYAVLDNAIYGLTKGQASPTTDPEFKHERGLAGEDERPLKPVLFMLGTGCGFVARTHAGNLPHMRQIFREAIAYPGFAFVHVMSACVTYQTPAYAQLLYERCELIPPDHDPSDLLAAVRMTQTPSIMLGVIYRRDPAQRPKGEVEMDGPRAAEVEEDKQGVEE
jgi:2-oxoglutarate ferredoxin oxidoreductase subunit beta